VGEFNAATIGRIRCDAPARNEETDDEQAAYGKKSALMQRPSG
jgi:hypothetical protein